MVSKLSSLIEITLFRARWLLVPLYVGLVAALVLLIYRFALEFVHMIQNVGDADAHKFTLDLLALLDLTLLANLILIVIKLIGSLVAISVIELLKDFIELSGQAEVTEGTVWRIIIHITFVISGVLFALMDWIADKRKFEGTY